MTDRLLAAADRSAAGFTEIRFLRRRRTLVVLRGRHVELATATFEEHGAVRCLSPGRPWGVAGFGSMGEVDAAARRAHELSLALPVAAAAPPPVPVPARRETLHCPAGRDPRDLPLAAKRRLADALAGAVLGADRRVVETRVRYQDALVETWVVTSDGSVLYEERPEISLAARVTAEEGGTSEGAFDSVAIPGTWAEAERWVATADRIARRAVERLHAPPVRPGRWPVVLDPRMAGLLVHRAIGHRCHADPAVDGAGPWPLGFRVGPEPLTVGDDGTAPGLRGTMGFDHEGSRPQNTTLIRHGVVVGHLHTRSTAAAAGVAVTGNARGTGSDAPVARLTNTYLANGRGTLDDLLRGIGEGVYLAEPRSARTDEGRVALDAGHVRMIRDGALAEPLKDAVLQGDPLALFGAMDAVAGDFRWDLSASRCDRVGAGTLPVSTGAPHVRLVEADIGDGA